MLGKGEQIAFIFKDERRDFFTLFRDWKTFHPHTSQAFRSAPLPYRSFNLITFNRHNNTTQCAPKRNERYMHIWVSPRFTFVKVIRWICSFSSCSSLGLYFDHLVTIMVKREKAFGSLVAISHPRRSQIPTHVRLAKLSHFYTMINDRASRHRLRIELLRRMALN